MQSGLGCVGVLFLVVYVGCVVEWVDVDVDDGYFHVGSFVFVKL